MRRILSVLMIFCMLTFPACAAPADQLVRLHVIAHSDSPEDQAIKLQVRDAVLTASRTLLSECRNADEAWTELNAHLTDFLDAASERLEEIGCDADVSVQAGVFAFPDRDYGGVILPAGDYRALRVIIGSGEGRNWWCVLFPNLCLPAEDGYRSILLDWLKDLIGGEHA